MTPKRLSHRSRAARRSWSLLVVGLLQLGGSSAADAAVEADARPDARALAARRRRWRRCTRRPSEILAGGLPALRARLAALRGHAGGDQQVGVLVRTLPRGVRRLPARLRRTRARGRVHRHRLGRHEPRHALRVPALVPGQLSELLRPQRPGRPRDHRLDVHARDRLLSTAAAASSSTRAPTRASPSSKRTSGATRWTPERAGAPHRPAQRAPDDRRRRALAAARRRAALRAAASRSTPSRTRSRRATRTARRPSCTRCAPAAARPTRPAGRCGSCRTCIPALDAAPERAAAPARRRRARRAAAPELFVSLPATGAHEVIVNGPQPVLSLAELPVEQVVRRGRGVARAHARARRAAPTCS